MNKQTSKAYIRRLKALRKARKAYEDAEIEHLRFRLRLGPGKLPKRIEAQLRKFIYERMLKVEIANLKTVDKR